MDAKRRAHPIVGWLFVPAVLVGIACSADPQPQAFDHARMATLGDAPLQIYAGQSTDDPDCLIWDILPPSVYEGDSLTGTVIINTDGDQLLDSEGGFACSADAGPGAELFLRDGEGDVLLTLWGRYGFVGEVEVPEVGTTAFKDTVFERDYEVWDAQIFAGKKWQGELLVTATAAIHTASPLRRLLTLALVDGVCGSNGLPPHPS